MNLDQLGELVQAAKAGKMLQQKWRGRTDSQWHDIAPHELLKGLMCCMDYDWRVKPEPREWWVNDYGDAVWKCWYTSRDAADILASSGRKRLLHLKEIEVIEFP